MHSDTREERTIWVGSLPPEAERDDIYRAFEKHCGTVEEVTVIAKIEGRYAFVLFSDQEAYDIACREYGGKDKLFIGDQGVLIKPALQSPWRKEEVRGKGEVYSSKIWRPSYTSGASFGGNAPSWYNSGAGRQDYNDSPQRRPGAAAELGNAILSRAQGHSHCAWVGSLPEDIREADLKKEFDRFGNIDSIKVVINSDNKPYAFINFRGRDSVRQLVKAMNGSHCFGSAPIVVKPSFSSKWAPGVKEELPIRDDHCAEAGGRSNQRERSRSRTPMDPPRMFKGRGRAKSLSSSHRKPRATLKDRSPSPKQTSRTIRGARSRNALSHGLLPAKAPSRRTKASPKRSRTPSRGRDRRLAKAKQKARAEVHKVGSVSRSASPEKDGQDPAQKPSKKDSGEEAGKKLAPQWRLLVENLPEDMSIDEFRLTAGRFGKVVDLKFYPQNDSISAIIGYATKEDLLAAKSKLDCRRVEGWPKRLAAWGPLEGGS